MNERTTNTTKLTTNIIHEAVLVFVSATTMMVLWTEYQKCTTAI